MATRPIFIPDASGVPGVEEISIDFKWHSGFSKSQKQKSIYELHLCAEKLGISRVLEISSKSEDFLGVKLSAFNLLVTTKKNKSVFSVETAFQGSKIFKYGGPYKDLFGLDSLSAKKDLRIKNSGPLVGFEFFGKKFSLEPKTFFYDWLYVNALIQNQDLAGEVLEYKAFSDIEFNPKKSINCQARSAAIYVSLFRSGLINGEALLPSDFLEALGSYYQCQNKHFCTQSNLI